MNMVSSTELQCVPCAGGTLMLMRACSQRANRAPLGPRSSSEGIGNQLQEMFFPHRWTALGHRLESRPRKNIHESILS
jgi:hypothetical protein